MHGRPIRPFSFPIAELYFVDDNALIIYSAIKTVNTFHSLGRKESMWFLNLAELTGVSDLDFANKKLTHM